MSGAKEESMSASLSTSASAEGSGSTIPNHDVSISPDSTWSGSKKRKTVLAVIVASIGAFSLGNVLTFSAPVLVDPEFKARFPDIGNGSWVATTALLGGLLAAPVAGLLIAKIGRRRTMLLSAMPFSAGWLMFAFAPNIAVLYTGRFLTGFCGGAFTVAVPTYVSEVSEDRIRGTLAVSFMLMLRMGQLFTLVLGALVNWFVLSVVCGCIPIVFFFSMLCMPESPRYLIQAQKPIEARNALQWLRGASTKRSIEPEISRIEDSVNAASQTNNNGSAKFVDLFTARVMKPIVISAFLMLFAQLSGINGVSLYTVEIFEQAGTGINARVASIIIGGTPTLTVLIVTFILVVKLGRRRLLIISELTMIVSLLALGTFFYLKGRNDGKAPEYLTWLPLLSLVSITIGYNVGLGPIPWVITSEILPNDVKELASACISISYWALAFVAGKSFQDIKDIVGYEGVYWLSAGVCFIGAIFVFFLVPETKGKTSEEIQQLFAPKHVAPEVLQSKSESEPPADDEGRTAHANDDAKVDNP